jgi:hypothetical protein
MTPLLNAPSAVFDNPRAFDQNLQWLAAKDYSSASRDAPQSGSSRFSTRAALVRRFSQLDIRSKAIGNNFLYDGLGIFPARDIYCDFDSYANQRHP